MSDFAQTYRDYLSPISKFLARRVDSQAVEDLASEVFEIAYRKRHQVKPGFELAWLYKIAGYVVANHRRKQNSRLQVITWLGFDALSAPQLAANPELIAIRDLELAEALKTLGPKDLALITLTALDDLPVKDAAGLIGISANAASIRLSRIRAQLAEKLA